MATKGCIGVCTAAPWLIPVFGCLQGVPGPIGMVNVVGFGLISDVQLNVPAAVGGNSLNGGQFYEFDQDDAGNVTEVRTDPPVVGLPGPPPVTVLGVKGYVQPGFAQVAILWANMTFFGSGNWAPNQIVVFDATYQVGQAIGTAANIRAG